MSNLTEKHGFKLTTLVEAQRGMTAREADHFLKTGIVPDLSLPPADDDPEVDKRVMTSSQARRVLAGELDLVAAAGGGNFLAQAPHHNELHHYKFNPNQPRDEDGRWTDDGLGGLVDAVKTAPKIPTQRKPPAGSGGGGGTQSTKKAIPAVIYKKHVDGTIVAQSGDGSRRMRWAAEPKKFIVEENKDGLWQETATLNKSSAYNDLKNPDKWFEPVDQSTVQDNEGVNTPDATLQVESNQSGQTSTNNEPPASFQTPEPDEPVVELSDETPTISSNRNSLRAAYDAGHTVLKEFTAGNVADSVELLELSNGSQVVRKKATPEETKKEFLSGLIGNAVGIDDVFTEQLDDQHVITSFVDGPMGGRVINDEIDKQLATAGKLTYAKRTKIAQSIVQETQKAHAKLPGGREIGLLDWLTANFDRHANNWIVTPDGHVKPIDHGNTLFKLTSILDSEVANDSPFVVEAIGIKSVKGVLKSIKPKFTAEELAAVKTRLLALEPEFTRLNEPEKFTFVISQIDRLIEGVNK